MDEIKKPENQEPKQEGQADAPEKRQYTGPDRRKRPTPFLSRYTLWGRRKKHRRLTDPQKNYYVDRIQPKYLVLIILIFTLSVIDSIFTIHHLKYGYKEINPVLAAVVFNNLYFIVVKYLLTIVGILALALHQFFLLVRELIILLIVLYIFLDVYQVWIYFKG